MRPKVIAVGRSSVAAVDAVERVEFETRRAVRVVEARHTIVIDVVVDCGDRCRTRGSGIVVPRHQCVALDAVRRGPKVGGFSRSRRHGYRRCRDRRASAALGV